MPTTRTVLLAGDHFVRNDILEEKLRAATGERHELKITQLTLPWPLVPFGDVAEVVEASDAEDAVVEMIDDSEVVITQMAPITERVIRSANALKLIVCTRGGPVNVNIGAATSQGIIVANAPGRNAVAAAEHTLALMLAAFRRIPVVHQSVVAGEWRSELYAYEECGRELAGSTVGLIGYGAIAQRVAIALQGFEANVIVYDPYISNEVLAPGIAKVELQELLRRSDTISLHARLSPETSNLIDQHAINAMRPGTVLINTARGGLVDYDDLYEPLKSGHLAAVGLDVFPEEPLPPNWPLLTLPNVVMTPHLAGATQQTAIRAAEIGAAAAAAYFEGSQIHGIVNPQADKAPFGSQTQK